MPYDRSSFLNLTMYAYTDTEKNMFQLFKYLKLYLEMEGVCWVINLEA